MDSKEIRQIAREAIDSNPTSNDDATAEVLRRVKRLVGYAEYIEDLVAKAIRTFVEEERHKINVQMRRESGYYGGQAKVVIADSHGVEIAKRSVYLYNMGGSVLGELTGEELPGIINREEHAGKGHFFNAALLKWILVKGIGAEQKVKNAVPEKLLMVNFTRIQREVLGEPIDEAG